MAGPYIVIGDITDAVITSFTTSGKLATKITLSDKAVEDMAERKGATPEQIKKPVHWQILRWATYWVAAQICLDHLGTNNVEIADIEKYRIKYELYKTLLDETETKITPSMITGIVDSRRDRATAMTGILFRS